MQRNNTPILIGTILFGLVALGATMLLLFKPAGPAPGQPTPGAPTPTPTPMSQLVALNDVPPRTVLTDDMVERRPVPAGKVPVGAISSVMDVHDMITNAPIRRGDVIALSAFTPRLKRVVSADIEVPMGMRAVGIWVDPDETAAGLVDVGDHVDVVATHKLTWDKGPNQFVIGAEGFTAGRTIAQDLMVLAVDRSIEAPTPTPTAAAPAAPGAPGAPPAADAAPPSPPPAPTAVPAPGSPAAKIRVLVAAKPEVAEHLIAANDQGILNITIRNPLDVNDNKPVSEAHEYPSRIVTILPVTAKAEQGQRVRRFPQPHMPNMPKMGGALPSPVTVPMPEPTRDVTVIRGTEKTRVLLPR